jgi:hypothetical protein
LERAREMRSSAGWEVKVRVRARRERARRVERRVEVGRRRER